MKKGVKGEEKGMKTARCLPSLYLYDLLSYNVRSLILTGRFAQGGPCATNRILYRKPGVFLQGRALRTANFKRVLDLDWNVAARGDDNRGLNRNGLRNERTRRRRQTINNVGIVKKG